MRRYDDRLREIFESGQSAGVFTPGVGMHLFRALIMGTLDYLCSPWARLEGLGGPAGALDGFYDLVLRAVSAGAGTT